jgi:hypothetical protein
MAELHSKLGLSLVELQQAREKQRAKYLAAAEAEQIEAMRVICVSMTPPELHDVAPDAPLRLSVAAALAFPDGSMSAAALRREHIRADSRSSASPAGITPPCARSRR